MLTVSEEFLNEAYTAACDSWKRKLENQFPDFFLSVERALANIQEYTVWKDLGYGLIKKEGKRLIIPLPNNNHTWTFAAWNLAMAIHRVYPCSFPRHEAPVDKLIIDNVFKG